MRKVIGFGAAVVAALVMTACSPASVATAPSGGGTVNVLASIADEVIGDARNACSSDTPTGLQANANNGKVDIGSRAVANVSRYVFRLEQRLNTPDRWIPVRDVTVDGKPLLTVSLPRGIYRVSVRTPCMVEGRWSVPVEFGADS